MRWHCRCSRCRARQVKRLHPDSYVKPAVCWSCKKSGTLIVDSWANRRPWRYTTCQCDAYHFPHNKGRGVCTVPRDDMLTTQVLTSQTVFDERLD